VDAKVWEFGVIHRPSPHDPDKGERAMNRKIEGAISVLVAFFLLISLLLQVDPLIMGSVAIAALVVLAIYQFTRSPSARS
jgi:hypothetical protein